MLICYGKEIMADLFLKVVKAKRDILLDNIENGIKDLREYHYTIDK